MRSRGVIVNGNLALLIRRILLVYLSLWVCRAVFWLYNCSIVGSVGWNEAWMLVRGALQFDTVSVLYANALFVVLSLVPFHVRERGWWQNMLFVYYIVVNSLGVALNLADTVYFRYTQKRFTADEIFFADNDNSMQMVLKFAAENWYLVVVFAALVAMLWRGFGRRRLPVSRAKNQVCYYSLNSLVLVAACVLAVGGIRGGFSRSVRPITLSNATQYTSSVNKANLILSNPFCIVRTLGNKKISYRKYYAPESLDEMFSPVHLPADSLAAPLRGRNVVVFVMESFSAEHSAFLSPELYPDGKGYTPFLDSLMRDGFTFMRGYANGHKSIEALPSVLGSIPSFKTPFVLLPQSLGESRQLPRLLADEGYRTAFFCGSERGSMGFGAYAVSAGVEQLYGREDYEKGHGKNDFDGYWGIWDEPFLQFMGECLGTFRQPFMAAAFTLTSHHPFVVPEQYMSLPAGTTKIHRGVQYTDLAVRRFFETYSNEEWFKNSVFVFVADHVSSETFAPETATLLGGCRIVDFIYAPDADIARRYDTVAQQIDIMPTLLGLMGYSKPYFAYGRDVVNEPDRPSTVFGYSTKAMLFYAADDNHVITFDENDINSVYSASDRLMQSPLAPPYPAAADSLCDYLKAVIQQYYTHIEAKNYVVSPSQAGD